MGSFQRLTSLGGFLRFILNFSRLAEAWVLVDRPGRVPAVSVDLDAQREVSVREGRAGL